MFESIKNTIFGNDNWNKCRSALKKDFGYEISNSPNPAMVKELWGKLTSEHKLSENASIALFYRIYFLSFLAAFKIMQDADEKELDKSLVEDLLPLLNKSIDYAITSNDYKSLEFASSHLNNSIEKMLNEIGVKWQAEEDKDYDSNSQNESNKIYEWIMIEDGLIDMKNPNLLIFSHQLKIVVQPGREGLLYNNLRKEIFIPAEDIKDFWKYC